MDWIDNNHSRYQNPRIFSYKTKGSTCKAYEGYKVDPMLYYLDKIALTAFEGVQLGWVLHK